MPSKRSGHGPVECDAAAEDKKLAARITESVRAIMDAKAALHQPAEGNATVGLSDREVKQHEAAIEAPEDRINKAVFALDDVADLPS